MTGEKAPQAARETPGAPQARTPDLDAIRRAAEGLMPETVVALVERCEAQQAVALKLAQEWQEVISTLATVVLDDAECATAITFKPEVTCHPFYAGKLSLLKTLKEMADADVERFRSDRAAALLDHIAELEAALDYWKEGQAARDLAEACRQLRAADAENARLRAAGVAYIDALDRGGDVAVATARLRRAVEQTGV